MTVWVEARLNDYSNLMCVSTTASSDADAEADPFDDMMSDAQPSGGDSKSGMLPESIKSTQGRPEGPLQ